MDFIADRIIDTGSAESVLPVIGFFIFIACVIAGLSLKLKDDYDGVLAIGLIVAGAVIVLAVIQLPAAKQDCRNIWNNHYMESTIEHPVLFNGETTFMDDKCGQIVTCRFSSC